VGWSAGLPEVSQQSFNGAGHVAAGFPASPEPARFAFSVNRARGLGWLGLAMVFAMAVFVSAMNSETRRLPMIAICCVGVIALLNMMAACGGSGGGGGNHGQTYVITITGTSGNYQHLTSVQLVVD
jgi:hypothetical protein